MGILNLLLGNKPKYAIKLKNSNVYISEKNKFSTSDFVKTKYLFNAKDFGSLSNAKNVLSVIDSSGMRYDIVGQE